MEEKEVKNEVPAPETEKGKESEKQEKEIIDAVIPDEQKKEEIKNRKKEKRN